MKQIRIKGLEEEQDHSGAPVAMGRTMLWVRDLIYPFVQSRCDSGKQLLPPILSPRLGLQRVTDAELHPLCRQIKPPRSAQSALCTLLSPCVVSVRLELPFRRLSFPICLFFASCSQSSHDGADTACHHHPHGMLWPFPYATCVSNPFIL